MRITVSARYTVFSRRLTGEVVYSEAFRGPRIIEAPNVAELVRQVKTVFPPDYKDTTGADDALSYHHHRLIDWKFSHDSEDDSVRIWSERDTPKLDAAWSRWEHTEIDRDVDAAGLDGPLDRPARQAPKGLQFRPDDKPDPASSPWDTREEFDADMFEASKQKE
jgi:hypothetical protein